MMDNQNEWKRIPRKLRAALVQIQGTGTPTISEDTTNELLRRGWILEGSRRVYKRGYENALITTDEWVNGWRLSTEGRYAWNERPLGNGGQS